jgi:hypothetical protein
MLTFQEHAGGPTGRLKYEIRRNGALIEDVDEQNIIVDLSKQIHAKLLGGSVTGQSVTQIGFGTSGAASAAVNTSLTDAYVKAIDSVTYPATNKVQFNFSLGSGEANGKAILEFGLFIAAGTLYARRIRTSALNKDSDISLSGSWTITF